MELLGREAESDSLDRLLREALAGQGGFAVLRVRAGSRSSR